MITCILLTAGESLRFGSPKALADIQHTKAIALVQQKLLKTSLKEIIIVTGAHQQLVKPYIMDHPKIKYIHNNHFKDGQTSSLQAGLSMVHSQINGWMLLPIDCPFVQQKTIEDLIAFFDEHNPEILIPVYQGKKGHPPVFHSKLTKDILALSKDKGLNSLFSRYQVQTLPVNDPGIVQSFNTKQELDEILRVI